MSLRNMTSAPPEPPRIGFLGAGAIARFLVSCLPPETASVTLLTRRAEQARALRRWGVTRVGAAGRAQRAVAAHAVSDLPRDLRLDALFVCVKSAATADALAACRNSLAPDAVVISAQNGLNDDAVAARADAAPGRCLGMVLSTPCQSVDDVTVRCLSAAPGAQIGALEAAGRGQALRVAGWFGPPLSLCVTDNLAGARWAKLAVNCATGPLLALTGLTLGGLIEHAALRRASAAIVGEILAVAELSGATPGPVFGLVAGAWIAGADDRADSALIAFGRANRSGRSSLSADYERGGQTEIEALIGAVIRAARQADVPTPCCDRLLSVFRQQADRPGRPPVPPEHLARLLRGEAHVH